MRKTKAIALVLVLALASCLAVACKKTGSGTTPPPAPPVDPVYEIELNTAALALQVGQSGTLIATPVKDGLVDNDAQLSWKSSDETVASVADGTVTALKQGQATITVTYRGETASAVVTVEYVEPSLVLSAAYLALTPGASETLTVETVGDIKPALYVWESSHPEIATVSDDGLVEAIAAGTTQITVSADIDGKIYSDSCAVTVSDRYDIKLVLDEEEYFAEKSYDMPVTIERNGIRMDDPEFTVSAQPAGAATYDKATGKLTIAKGVSGAVSVTVSGYGATRAATIECFIEIKDKASFDQLKDRREGQFKVTADIDYGGAAFVTAVDTQFKGTIDGQGHVIYNAKTSQSGTNLSILGAAGNGAAVRNLAFVGIQGRERCGGIFAYGDGYTIDNCFMEITYDGNQTTTAPAGNNPAGIIAGKVRADAVVRNCITVVTFTEAPKNSVGAIVAKTEATGKVENCYAYVNLPGQEAVSTITEGIEPNTRNAVNCGVYTTVAQFAEMDRSDFAADLWHFGTDVVPMFKNAKMQELLAVMPTVSQAEASIIVGTEKQLQFEGTHYEISVSPAVEGVTVDDSGLVTVAPTVAEDTKFNVSATSIFDTTKKASVAFTVKLPSAVYTIAFAKPSGDLFVGRDYDMPVTMTKDGEPFSTSDYDVVITPATAAIYDKATGKLTIQDSGEITVKISYENAEHSQTLAGWYEIKDKTSFQVTNVKRAGWFKLTADVDYGGDAFDNPSSTAFTGIIDGQGHTIYNAKTSQIPNNLSIFGQAGVGAIARNLAFAGIQGKERCGGIFAYGNGYLIENCFMEMTYDGNQTTTAPTGNNPAGIIAGKVGADAIVRNCITVVTFTEAPKNSVGAIVAKTEATGKIENCYAYVNLPGQEAVSTITEGIEPNTRNAVNCGVYTTVAEFLAGIDRAKLTASVWGFPENALPSFDSTSGLLAKAPTAATTAEVIRGEERQLTATGTHFEFELAAVVEGVTLAPTGLIAVSESVAVGTTFTVNVASIFDKEVKTAIEVTVIAPPSSVITVSSATELTLKMVTGYSAVSSAIIASSSGGETLTYASSAPAVATVSDDGMITPTGEGNATITVGIESGSALSVEITVTVVVFTPITTIEEFNNIEKNHAVNGIITGNFMLMNDIDASIDTTLWLSLGNYHQNNVTNGTKGFRGVFDGNGHTVSNLTPIAKAGATNGNNVAPFGTIMAGGIVRNISFVNLTLNNTIAGGIANMNYGTIENCYVDATFTQFHSNTNHANPSGGIAAKHYGKIVNCIAVVSTTATANLDRFGGIVGGMYNDVNIVEKSFTIGREYMACPGRTNDATMNKFNKFDAVSKAFADADAFFAEGAGADVTVFDSAIWNIDGANGSIGLRPGCSFAGTKL